MAFPGTYNFSYYKGDTLEFRIYPKDGAGDAFSLDGYDNVTFTIASVRGHAGVSGQVECHSEIVNDEYVLCAIKPSNGAALSAGTQYVYDVEISKTSSPYDYVYTILTGTVTVTEQITGAV